MYDGVNSAYVHLARQQLMSVPDKDVSPDTYLPRMI